MVNFFEAIYRQGAVKKGGAKMNLRRRGPQSVSYCILPSHLHGRDIPAWAMEDADVEAQIDTHTLFYDVFAGENANTVVAVGPPLKRPMRRFIKQAEIALDGVPAIVTEVSQTRRSCTLEITSAVENPTQLVINHPTLSFRQCVGPSLRNDYAGKQTLFTLSQDNDLQWIHDWARFHVEVHCVNGLVFFDNASKSYGTDQIMDVLSDIAGLDVFDVVAMPFQYGPSGSSREHLRHRFLQFGVFEIARRRFLGNAAAVLNMDVDELAYAPEGQTVFDQLTRQEQGFLTLEGEWRYPIPDAPVCHATHVLHAETSDDIIYPKWCLDPQANVKGKSWRTHGIKGLPNQQVDGFGFLHCRMISNNWSYDRSGFSADALRSDTLAERVLRPLERS